MSNHTAKQTHLINRPGGMPSHEHFKLVEVELPAPGAGAVYAET